MVNGLNLGLVEYVDKVDTTRIVIAITLGLIVLLFWVWITFEETIALAYMIMGVLALLIIFAEKSNAEFVDVVLFGEGKMMLVGIFAGAILGWLFVSTGQFIIGTPPKLATAGTFDFLYVVISAAWMESIFFFGALNPTLMQYFGKPIGLLIGSGVFGVFHFAAYGGATALMIAAFAFSLIATILSYVLKTQAFGVSLHFVNNWLVWIK